MHATAVSQQRILTATSLLPTPPAASSIVPACRPIKTTTRYETFMWRLEPVLVKARFCSVFFCVILSVACFCYGS
eukprot:COSAG06_NODE_7598_length_2446_cov_2.262037_1_plen_75_part_00